jgi:hypothetical protein
MGIAALVTWVVTAILGITMVSLWATKGGLQAARGGTEQTSQFPPGLVFGHFLLAVAGLILWIVYLVVDAEALPWVAFVALIVIAVLGGMLFLRWRRGLGSPAVESGLPKPVVYIHGLFAVATVLLVLLAALGVGES